MIATRPTAAQIERARHLLAHEGAVCSVAAGRVLDKLNAHLDPLIGEERG